MGSFFLHDDYRLPEYNNVGGMQFKKEVNSSSGSTQGGLFENNICIANIKRGLGFAVGSDAPANNGVSNADNDDWTYTRARASPVVERLILQEIQNDIADSAMKIGVSMDPRQWCVEDTRKWLQWVADLYQIGDQTSNLLYDGRTLCGFTEDEFIYFTGSEDAGLKIAAQLDLWKNAIKMTPSAGSYHFQQQQAMDQKLGTQSILGRQENNTPKLLETGCSWSVAPPQFTTSDILSSSNQLVNGGVSNNTTTEPPTYPDMSAPSPYQPYNVTNSQLPPYSEPMGRSTPRPTIPLEKFRSVREECQQHGFLSWQKYQELTTITPSRHAQNMMFANKNRAPASSTAPNNFDAQSTPSSSSNPMTFVQMKEEAPKTLACAEIPITNDTKVGVIAADYNILDGTELKTEKVDSGVNLTVEEPSSSKAAEPEKATVKKKSSKHPIHLWEFLKQLLCDGKECIRWLDQEKGVFKIYNSQEVAKFWGERKNRPAMNYDKLSRSIRQYYKKGIIKKTSQGKRLVYQFCQGYI